MKKDNKYELAVFEDNDKADLVEYSKQMQESIEKALDNNKGEKGEKGDKGDSGNSLPIGGTTGQVLTKKSETYGDVEWSTVEGNEVYIGNEADAPATAKIVIDEEETGWEDEGEIYSTTERKVGKWVDGKTLYRKVINTTAPTCEQDGTYVTSTIDIADNIDFAVIELGFIVDSANQKQTFPYINNSGNVIKAFINVNKQIHLAHNIKSYNGYAVTIIVKYTKTTEEA